MYHSVRITKSYKINCTLQTIHLPLLTTPSWGFGCANPRFPGVYARVSTLEPWIRRIVDKYWLADWHTVRMASCQTVRLSDCQTVRFSNCPNVRLLDCQTFRLSDYQTFSLSGSQAVRLSDCQKIRLSGCQAVRLSDCQTVGLSEKECWNDWQTVR